MPSSSSLATWANELRRRLGDWIERNPEGAARIALWMEEQVEHSGETMAPVDLLQSFMEAFVPRNWWPLRIGLHERARRTMAESGVCLIWVPPSEVVEAVVSANGKEDRDKALLASAPQILDSIEEALLEVAHPKLEGTVMAAREALAVHRAGFTMAAQSLTAVILSEIVEGHFGFDGFGDARAAFEREPASMASVWSSRRTTVQEAILVAIMRSDNRPPGAGFNRHLSVHGVDPRQFREPHALEGLMLLAGAIRELHEIYRVAERGFGPSPRLSRYARDELLRRMEIARREQELSAHESALLN